MRVRVMAGAPAPCPVCEEAPQVEALRLCRGVDCSRVFGRHQLPLMSAAGLPREKEINCYFI